MSLMYYRAYFFRVNTQDVPAIAIDSDTNGTQYHEYLYHLQPGLIMVNSPDLT